MAADFHSVQGMVCTKPRSNHSGSQLTLSSQLFLNDTAKMPVAVFHRKRLGILRTARPASLEIFPVGEAIADIIIVTFIYMEKMRKDRE